MKHLKTFENYGSESGNEPLNSIPYTSGNPDLPETIWSKVLASRTSGWYGEQLQETTECINMDNDWLVDLSKYSNDPQVKAVLDKIEDNRFDLWKDDLENTFDCVLTEDLHEDGESKFGPKGNIVVKYNGWFEDLENLI